MLENFKGAIICHAIAIDFQDALARAEPGSHRLRAWETGALDARARQRSQVPAAPANSCVQSMPPPSCRPESCRSHSRGSRPNVVSQTPIFWTPACPHSDRLQLGGRETPKLPLGHRLRKSRAQYIAGQVKSIPVSSTTGPKQRVLCMCRLTDRSRNRNKWPAASSLRDAQALRT